MTAKELYEWAVEHGCENLPLRIWYYGEVTTVIEPDVDSREGYLDI